MRNLLIIIPLFDEYEIIEKTVKKMKNITNNKAGIAVSYYEGNLTPKRVKVLEELKGVEKIGNKENGRGAMVTNAYFKLRENYSAFMYVDADVPFDELGIKNIAKEIIKGEYDIVVGSKQRGRIKASILRKTISKSYYFISNFFLFGKNKGIDFQTGIKAWKKKVIEDLFPNNDFDKHWFFDTELLYYAIKKGKKIKFIGVDSKIGGASTVRLSRDIPYFLKKLIELKIRDKEVL